MTKETESKGKVLPMEFPKHECYNRSRMWSARTLTTPCPWHAMHKEKVAKFKQASKERGARKRLIAE